ncbi:MAG TPA: hypothetical protein VHV51_06380 [Polyangiaceae bacterium]|jgi:hypothetical protein|nr:hypothetical protein [Polyangiaceae bacterium]
MAAHAGEKARKTGDFKCKGCGELVHATRGKPIPKCKCGATEFDERRNEPGNKSSSPSHLKHGQHKANG